MRDIILLKLRDESLFHFINNSNYNLLENSKILMITRLLGNNQ